MIPTRRFRWSAAAVMARLSGYGAAAVRVYRRQRAAVVAALPGWRAAAERALRWRPGPAVARLSSYGAAAVRVFRRQWAVVMAALPGWRATAVRVSRRRGAAAITGLVGCCAAAVLAVLVEPSHRELSRAVARQPAVSVPEVQIVSGPVLARRPELPGGRKTVFGDNHFLVAYYGTAGTGVLGVLGETGIDTADQRLREAAAPFRRQGERIQPVYELIVTVADARPGKDGDYNHDIDAEMVRDYVDAAHRHGALLLLDIQPGRSDFLTVAKRWEWALRDPLVGLALDPEWRMGPKQVPGRVIGGVDADEVNRTSEWLADLVSREGLPEKLLVLHQFRSTMIRPLAGVEGRPGLAEVQHIDGFGRPGQKLDTYRSLVDHRRFRPGFKLFYDEDRPRMSAAAVRAIDPAVRFVSFQ